MKINTLIPFPSYDKQLQEIQEQLKKNSLHSKEFLNIDEASDFIGLSKSTLYKLTSTMKITHYKPDKKIYFKRTDLETYILNSKVSSFDEISQDIDNQLLNSKKTK